ncbi:LysM peptidoglycan-binding domain-containing protein [Aggregatilinea lenta]|uniref:LysM peptidoglycan-binding domain-containing protein n=1 Tax=Aggregatilinea lenta TaxID=913108 RepID=UPI000E5B7335|nr:LysM peptidoglycan-binding domain-containing protein [Aggregatilinea lenta]
MRQRQYVSARALVGLVVALAVVVVSLGVIPSQRASAYQTGNLLQNPGFEAPFVSINGDTTLQVATGWQPWNLAGGSSSALNARPEYKAAPTNRVRSGSSAQEYNTFYATHDAGVYQRVAVTPGTALQFSVYAYIWSSATFDNPSASEDPNDVQIRVGIDPTGGTDPASSNIVWSAPVEYYDQYRMLSVTATSSSTAVTAFVRSQPQDFVGTTNIFLDDAYLGPTGSAPVETQAPQPTTAPQPTSAPVATTAPQPTTAPQATTVPVPTSTPVSSSGGFSSTVTYVVQRGDTVSALAAQYGSTVAAIVQANSLSNSALIYVGQTLIIPVTSPYTVPPTFTPAPIYGQPGAQPTAVASVGGTYTVAYGDTLTSIAARYNTTAAVLAQLNNIVNPNLIYSGQVLSIPGVVVVPTVPTQPTTPATGATTHTVRPGENLYRISLMYGVTMDALQRANGIYNPNLIFTGQILTIPR